MAERAVPELPLLRPSLTSPLEAIVARLIAVVPDLAGLTPTHVLVVSLGAHGTAAASVRSLIGSAAAVTVRRSARKAELGLRPPFFLDGDAPRRLTTLVHELLHLDPARPGRLLEDRRHATRSHAAHEAHARKLARTHLQHEDPVPLACLAHHGEVTLRTWRHRPIEETARRRFGDADVLEAPLVMMTPAGARGGWW